MSKFSTEECSTEIEYNDEYYIVEWHIEHEYNEYPEPDFHDCYIDDIYDEQGNDVSSEIYNIIENLWEKSL